MPNSYITTVKDLVRSGYVYAGVLGEQADLQGDRFQMGLMILNQLITQANTQVFLPFAQVIKDLPPSYQVYILSEDPDIVSNQNEIPDAVKPLGPAKIIEAPQPKIINSVGYKVGIKFTAMNRISMSDMMRYILPVGAAPNLYAYEEHAKYTVLALDRPSNFPVRVTYSRCLDLKDADDKVDMPLQYVEYLMYGLAYRLAIKYQQPVESIAGIKSLFDASYQSIIELNKNDHMITWADTYNGSYGWFGSIYAPPSWS